MPLTDKQIKALQPEAKAKKYFDGGGLHLEVTAGGKKYWRLKYRYGGKENRISFGVYPEVSLREAREQRLKAKASLRANIDPSEERKAEKAPSVDTFEALAREWFTTNLSKWSKSYSDKLIQRLENHVFPHIGSTAIESITAPLLLSVMRGIESTGAVETARRQLAVCGRIFRYGISTGRADRDPSADIRGEVLATPEKRHFAAVTDPEGAGRLLVQLDSYFGSPVIKAGLKLAPLVFVRPGELRTAKWADIDLDAAEWRYVAQKTGVEMIVPLSSQALAVLRELMPYTRQSEYVFPSARSDSRALSDNGLRTAMRSMGITNEQMSVHGFRAMARTLLDEQLQVRVDYIEHQLGHVVKDPNGRAYNRTTHLEERRKMMQKWADYLDILKAKAQGGNITAFRQVAG